MVARRGIVRGFGWVMGAVLVLGAVVAADPAAAQRAPRQVAQTDTGGPRFTSREMHDGITMSRAECERHRETVHVESHGVGICMRYYLSSAGGIGNEAVVWLSGDKSPLQIAERAIAAGRPDEGSANERWARHAEAMSLRYRRPAIHLARVGLDGSSGWHGHRRTWFEVEATHLALDAIASRHGFAWFHLMGQSGGGHLVGALIGTRRDVGCAVPGSGRIAQSAEYVRDQRRQEEDLRHYNPIDAVASVIAASRAARILVVTSPTDQVVPAAMQLPFVEAVRRGGGRATQFLVAGLGDQGHFVESFTREVMAGCLAGASDQAIARTVEQMNQVARSTGELPSLAQQTNPAPVSAIQGFVVPPIIGAQPAAQIAGAPARTVAPPMPRSVPVGEPVAARRVEPARQAVGQQANGGSSTRGRS